MVTPGLFMLTLRVSMAPILITGGQTIRRVVPGAECPRDAGQGRVAGSTVVSLRVPRPGVRPAIRS